MKFISFEFLFYYRVSNCIHFSISLNEIYISYFNKMSVETLEIRIDRKIYGLKCLCVLLDSSCCCKIFWYKEIQRYITYNLHMWWLILYFLYTINHNRKSWILRFSWYTMKNVICLPTSFYLIPIDQRYASSALTLLSVRQNAFRRPKQFSKMTRCWCLRVRCDFYLIESRAWEEASSLLFGERIHLRSAWTAGNFVHRAVKRDIFHKNSPESTARFRISFTEGRTVRFRVTAKQNRYVNRVHSRSRILLAFSRARPFYFCKFMYGRRGTEIQISTRFASYAWLEFRLLRAFDNSDDRETNFRFIQRW